MKELILLRHAKSSWDYAVADRDRVLQEKGIQRIINVATQSAHIFEGVEVVISSPAIRALHTATLLIKTLQLPFSLLKVNETLYTFDAAQLIDFIHQLDDSHNKVVLVGHNPAFTDVAAHFGDQPEKHLSTAAWARIRFENADWKTLLKGQIQYGIPNELLT